MWPGRPGKLSERLLTCKNPLHSLVVKILNIKPTCDHHHLRQNTIHYVSEKSSPSHEIVYAIRTAAHLHYVPRTRHPEVTRDRYYRGYRWVYVVCGGCLGRVVEGQHVHWSTNARQGRLSILCVLFDYALCHLHVFCCCCCCCCCCLSSSRFLCSPHYLHVKGYVQNRQRKMKETAIVSIIISNYIVDLIRHQIIGGTSGLRTC